MQQDLILEQREHRSLFQKELLNKYNKTLIVIKANYPSANKQNHLTNYLVCNFFFKVKELLNIINYEATLTLEGLIFYLVVDEDSELVKRKTIELEDNAIGRLVDIDVYDNDKQLSRTDFNIAPRKCFICNKEARECVRNQNHDLIEVIEYFNKLVVEDIFSKNNVYSNLTIFGLINELCKTITFGTVGINNQGSHTDMNYKTFIESIKSISNKMEEFNKIDSTSFENLRNFGLILDDGMFKATNSINTHKGAIFSLLLLYSGLKNTNSIQEVSDYIKNICINIYDDFKQMDESNGIMIFKENKITGIRGLAYTGYEFLFNDVFKFYKENNKDDLKTFIYIISKLDDTTIINRKDLNMLNEIKIKARDVLENKVSSEELDNYFITNNISSGGSADILSMLYILDIVADNYNLYNKAK